MSRTDTFPGTIDRPGTSWRWRVRLNGDRHSYTLPKDGDKELPPEPDLEDVEAFARREFDRLKADVKADRGRAIPLSALIKRFREDELPGLSETTQEAYGATLDRIRLYFVRDGTDPRVRDVDAGDCDAFLSWRRWHTPAGEKLKEPLGGNTLRRERAVLSRLFTKAVTWGYREGNPVSRTEVPKADGRDPVILDADQYEALLEAAGESRSRFLYLFVLVLGEAGLRSGSEALWLQFEDVDLEDGFLQVRSGRDGHRTKSGKGRWVPLTPRLKEAFRDHFAENRMQTFGGERTPWIFHHLWDHKGARAGDRIDQMRTGFRKACERAELPDDFRAHDLRHRRVTTWLSEGHSPVKVQKALGHSDLKTTMGYYTFVRSDLESLVEPQEKERKELAELAR